ncbi:MAG TPA: iron-containing alcohol dehydrogenase [Anaerohalosphaeraceae bacterium]|nr:iron-containing alcohol dehydrogenase [Anaerohalosphaeraceae bacterium]HRT50984.1 iron-containing alcohol dehydrogenase [Anaerohalosphaeraceae bacterium]HRT86970.1 iron-containing alcohol dehydrogenase [Anaerohalosphaeraceae bacterium]
MKFEFATASRIIFGAGIASHLNAHVRDFGTRAFVITGSAPRHAAVLDSLTALTTAMFAVSGEPSVDILEKAVAQARHAGCEVVVGIGGGSVIDTAKAVAALLTNPGDVMQYLEVVGEGKPLAQPAAPCIAVPTTAGTGAEVTRNAVLYVPEKHVKVSMRSASMLPRLAVVDPELTRSMPREVTAFTGLDALTQLIEPYVSSRANPLMDGICIEGLTRAARSLRRAYENGDDMAAREDMSLASLFGGLALANAGLGAIHGFAGPLGGMIAAPHGLICGRLLPHVMCANIQALQARQPASPALQRYSRIAQILTGDPKAAAPEAAAWAAQLCKDLNIPSLTSYGFTPDHIPEAVKKARNASSMKPNPIALTDEELAQILSAAL